MRDKKYSEAIDLTARSRFPASMELITTTESLATLCRSLAAESFITVDTEFMRESTYWPDLCLIQVAGETLTGLIDPMAPGIDLQPFFDLMNDANVLKVFHAARQDIEIMVHRAGIVPHPVFDTQIAAIAASTSATLVTRNVREFSRIAGLSLENWYTEPVA